MNKQNNEITREQFGSQFGAIMAAVGSAVGLGNIWRFSYITGVNGGGAFLLVYILCVIFIGITVMIVELTIGRRAGKSTVSAFLTLAPGSPWWIAGAFGVLAPTLIAFYYPVVSGWALGYVFESIFSWDAMTADTAATFEAFSSGWHSYVFSFVALALTVFILVRGVAKGIERVSKFLMPLLGVLMIVLVVRSLTLPGAVEGLKFLFYPDFRELTVGGFLDALGHSFYSLSLGMGIMITYASYMSRKDNLVRTTISVVTLDTLIAVFAGMAIFPAVFAMGLNPGEGAGLAFVTLPAAFATMPLGRLFCPIFFLLLFIAALTSMISILQVPLALLEDRFHMVRRKGLAFISVLCVCFGTPAALSFGPLKNFTIFGLDYFSFLDKFANNIVLPTTALLCILFVIFKFGVATSKEEFLTGSRGSRFLAQVYPFAVRTIAPAAIVVILLRAAGLF